MRKTRMPKKIRTEISKASYLELHNRFVSDVLSGKYDDERNRISALVTPKDPYLKCEEYIDRNGQRVLGLCSHALNRGILVYEGGILDGPGPHPKVANR